MKQKVRFGITLYSIVCSLLMGCGQAATGNPDAESESSFSTVTATQKPPEATMPPVSATSPVVTAVPPSDIFGSTAQPDSCQEEVTAAPEVTAEPTKAPPLRDNTPYCPVPEAPGTQAEGNEVAYLDVSNQSNGYIMAKYTGSCPKVKIIISGPNSYKCTYDLNSSEYQAFPLTAGSGSYTIGIYENIEGTAYSTAYSMVLEANILDEFSPYLRPSQYVNYNANTYAVTLASQLCADASSDLDCVSIIYNYLIDNITYDHAKAENAVSGNLTGYLPQIDESLSAGKGICVDYAAIMTCMLRTQRIPTRLEVGYAGNAYHAWISTYIKDVGWVNGIIQFDGKSWSLMDPTFGASTGEKELRDFIGDGTNYTVKYIY